jgi:L-serine/L-threonine ammonia-lyase
VTSLHVNTPLLRAAPGLFEHPEVWLKMDALQPSGSFKLRGVGRLVQQSAADGARAIVCASGGNAGFAATYAAVALGLPVTIVLPLSSSATVAERLAARGAEVLRHGAVWDEAHEFAVRLAAERGAAYVHPFDHPLLWAGHSTLIDEVFEAGVEFDAVVTAVGGGGLFCGIVEGLRRHGLDRIPVIAVETEGAASLQAALAAGELVSLPAITSIATSLGARCVAPEAFERARSHPTVAVQVSDAQATAACARFADAQRVLVEPACGAALAAVDRHAAGFRRVLVEVCGGMGVSLELLRSWTTAPTISP